MSAPCLKCGAETEHRVEFTGLLEAEVFMCEACFGPANAEMEERRRQFDQLIASGMPRASANAVMIGRIDEAERIRAEKMRS